MTFKLIFPYLLVALYILAFAVEVYYKQYVTAFYWFFAGGITVCAIIMSTGGGK